MRSGRRPGMRLVDRHDRYELLQIRTQGTDQIVGPALLFACGASVLRQNVEPNMSLDHFGHHGVHPAAASRDIVDKFAAIRFLIQSPLNRVNLAHNPPDVVPGTSTTKEVHSCLKAAKIARKANRC
jgi:hypothetical protein